MKTWKDFINWTDNITNFNIYLVLKNAGFNDEEIKNELKLTEYEFNRLLEQQKQQD